jgi:hypothetical protein
MASVVEHPALARMLDVGDDDALARTFLVTDRIDSVALSDADVEALPSEVVDAITWQLADALRYLHERGLGHACIRAANVQLSRTAAVDHQGGLFVRLGLLGLYDLRAGRPGPANGPASAPDSRADDVYDLGVLLAEAFGPQAGTGSSGWFPFRRGGDPSWNALIAAMMSPDPAARPAAADVSAAARAVTGLVSSGRSGGRS